MSVAAPSAERILAPPAAWYLPVGKECEIFRHAMTARLPLMVKGPTGCGKTRFIQYMAETLQRPLITVSCNEDTSATDLLGRHLLIAGETGWSDGPVTRAVRTGAILYLDEIAEARADALVVIHSLSDHRRELFLDRTVRDSWEGSAAELAHQATHWREEFPQLWSMMQTLEAAFSNDLWQNLGASKAYATMDEQNQISLTLSLQPTALTTETVTEIQGKGQTTLRHHQSPRSPRPLIVPALRENPYKLTRCMLTQTSLTECNTPSSLTVRLTAGAARDR